MQLQEAFDSYRGSNNARLDAIESSIRQRDEAYEIITTRLIAMESRVDAAVSQTSSLQARIATMELENQQIVSVYVQTFMPKTVMYADGSNITGLVRL